MSASTLPKTLARALKRYDAALERLHESVDAWMADELCALSARLKNRTVTIYAGNGAISVEIERCCSLAYGDWNERKAFRLWDFTGQIRWARWVEVPHAFATLDQFETDTGIDFAPLGCASFRNGAKVDQ